MEHLVRPDKQLQLKNYDCFVAVRTAERSLRARHQQDLLNECSGGVAKSYFPGADFNGEPCC